MRKSRLRFNAAVLRRDRAQVVGAALSLALFAMAVPGLAPTLARAQIAASASVTTDYRYRGVAVSDARPAVSLDLAYDSSGGAYAGGSLVASNAPGAGPRILGALADLGYARRVGDGLALDVGVSHASFFRYAYGAQSSENTEVYAGLSRGRLRAYVHYSPHYFVAGLRTLYFGLDGSLPAARHLRLFGHLGALDSLSSPAGVDFGARYDASAGVATPFRGGEVQLACTAHDGGSRGYPGTPQRDSALMLGASWFF